MLSLSPPQAVKQNSIAKARSSARILFILSPPIKKCAAGAAHEKCTASNRRDASYHTPRNEKRRMHFYRSKIRTLGAFYVLTCVAPLSYAKYHRFARIIQLIEQRNQLVTRLPIRYTQTLFATRKGLLVTRRPLLVTRKRLFATRLDRGNFKEIHISKRSISVNILFLHKNVCFCIVLNMKISRLTLSKLAGKCGTPEGTRTPNPRNRNPMLYPLSHRCVFISPSIIPVFHLFVKRKIKITFDKNKNNLRQITGK